MSEKRVTVQYYAVLREQRGCQEETINTDAPTVIEFYKELREKYHFHLSTDVLKVAVNDEFADWNTELKTGDHIVFIPPVAGG